MSYRISTWDPPHPYHVESLIRQSMNDQCNSTTLRLEVYVTWYGFLCLLKTILDSPSDFSLVIKYKFRLWVMRVSKAVGVGSDERESIIMVKQKIENVAPLEEN